MKRVLGKFLRDLDPKVKVKDKKAGICDGVPSTAALVYGFKGLIKITHTAYIIVTKKTHAH